jgi:N-methylhydantoinase B
VQTRLKSLVPGRLNVASGDGGRLTCPPWGLRGGGGGAVAGTLVKGPGEESFHAPLSSQPVWPAGTEVLYLTAGGGGWGDPLERAPDRVLHDVREGYVSAASAREHYGVVLGADGGVDAAATTALRQQRRGAAPRATGSP